MSDIFFKKYIDELCREEGLIQLDDPSSQIWHDYGRLIDENRDLYKLVQKQREIIKLATKQKETIGKQGLQLRWTELTNTIWKKILNFPQNREINDSDLYYSEELEFKQLSKYFIDYIFSMGYSGNAEIKNCSANLFFDITSSINKDYISGIQRVVLELGRELIKSDGQPIFLYNEKAFCYNKRENCVAEVDFVENDCIIFLDHSWDFNRSVAKIIAKNRASRGINVCVLYDIIPLNYPQFFEMSQYYIFNRWFETISQTDLLLCISSSVANDVRSWYEKKNINIIPSIKHFNLGANFEFKSGGQFSDQIKFLLSKETKIFLSVGTIEPRKAYSVAINAVEEAWASGCDFIYVIVGRIGYSQNKLINRILKHCEFNKRLFWFNSLSNEELSELYRSARYLVFPSIIEGYGLPLIEAAHYGTQALLSDIDVFREIAGDNAIYFEVANPSKLAEKIIDGCNTEKIKSTIKTITWREFGVEIMEHINHLIGN